MTQERLTSFGYSGRAAFNLQQHLADGILLIVLISEQDYLPQRNLFNVSFPLRLRDLGRSPTLATALATVSRLERLLRARLERRGRHLHVGREAAGRGADGAMRAEQQPSRRLQQGHRREEDEARGHPLGSGARLRLGLGGFWTFRDLGSRSRRPRVLVGKEFLYGTLCTLHSSLSRI